MKLKLLNTCVKRMLKKYNIQICTWLEYEKVIIHEWNEISYDILEYEELRYIASTFEAIMRKKQMIQKEAASIKKQIKE